MMIYFRPLLKYESMHVIIVIKAIIIHDNTLLATFNYS